MECFVVGAAVGPSNPCQQLHARQRPLWLCCCYASNRQVKKKEKGNPDSIKAVLYIRVGHMILKQAGYPFCVPENGTTNVFYAVAICLLKRDVFTLFSIVKQSLLGLGLIDGTISTTSLFFHSSFLIVIHPFTDKHHIEHLLFKDTF